MKITYEDVDFIKLDDLAMTRFIDDVKNTFFRGDLEEEIYMDVPIELEHSSSMGSVQTEEGLVWFKKDSESMV